MFTDPNNTNPDRRDIVRKMAAHHAYTSIAGKALSLARRNKFDLDQDTKTAIETAIQEHTKSEADLKAEYNKNFENIPNTYQHNAEKIADKLVSNDLRKFSREHDLDKEDPKMKIRKHYFDLCMTAIEGDYMTRFDEAIGPAI